MEQYTLIKNSEHNNLFKGTNIDIKLLHLFT